MSADDIFLEQDALNYLWLFAFRFVTFTLAAIRLAICSWPIPLCYGIAWFTQPSLLPWIFWSFHAYFCWRDNDVEDLFRDLSFAMCGFLPWGKIAFGLIHTGIPLASYVFTAVLCHEALKQPRWTWDLFYNYFSFDIFNISSAIMALTGCLSVEQFRRTLINHALTPVWQVITQVGTSLACEWVSFCRGRGHFIIFWWRIRERRQDRAFHNALERLYSKKLVEDIRDKRSDKFPYKYRPLAHERQIRLLELSMGEIRDIKCELLHVDVDKAGDYAAISYTWGESTRNHGIVVDGAWLVTTASAYDVVFKSAPMHGTRRIWIDFVCINQADDLEKAKQVRLMRDVYSSATEVITYLGEVGDDVADYTEYFLRDFYESRQRHTRMSRASRIVIEQKMQYLGLQHPRWFIVTSLINHAYWTRIWIIQEIAHARSLRIMYGDRELPLEAFQYFIHRMLNPETRPFVGRPESIDELGDNPMYGVVRILSIFALRDKLQAQAPEPTYLKDILPLYRSFSATDRRDFVFGLQGCVTEPIDADLLPDYTVRTEELFIRVACYFTRQDGTLSIFEQAGIHNQKGFSSLPSWVPDWSSPQPLPNADNQTKGICQVKITVQPEGLPSQRAVLDVTKGVLQIKGIRLGTISEIVAIPLIDELRELSTGRVDMSKYAENFRFKNWANAWANLTQRISGPYVTGESSEDALRRMLLGDDQTDEETDKEDKERISALYRGVETSSKDINGTPPGVAPFELGKKGVDENPFGFIKTFLPFTPEYSGLLEQANLLLKILTQISVRCTGRTIALIDNGYMALVPQSAKVGDDIFLIAGNGVPYVLRNDYYYPSSPLLSKLRRNPHYCLVGDSYIYGLTADDDRIAQGSFQTIDLH
jgi:hypothetical protein